MPAKTFIQNINDEEWRINGHRIEDAIYIIHIFDDMIPHLSFGSILDLGCGTGLFCRYLEDVHPGKFTFFGQDINPEAINLAKLSNQLKASYFSVGDFFDLNAEYLNKFDQVVITVGDTDHDYIKKVDTFLRSLHMHLKENIKLFLLCYDKITPQNTDQLDKLNKLYTFELFKDRFFLIKKN